MTPWLRRLHKWIGLLIAIQFLLWMVSGLGMAWLEHDQVQGKTSRAAAAEAPPWPADALPVDQVIAAADAPVYGVTSAWLHGSPVYEVAPDSGVPLLEARRGRPVTLDADLALRIATASYTGPGTAATPQRTGPTLETRIHAGDVWRVDFDDADNTTVYLAAETGRVLVHRNDTWRLFDIFWMLHIMDYTGRADFNNPLVVMMGIGGLWMALTGVWLLFASFHLAEFLPRRLRRRGTLAVHAANGGLLRTLQVTRGDDAYVALARQGLQLPSNCGGGQSCGMCEVRVRGHAPEATAADRAHIGDSRLRMGYRLACNLPLGAEQEIEVGGGAALWSEVAATVERVETPTPFLRELVLRPAVPVDDAYRAGTYVQLHVPAYALNRDALRVPAHHAEAWNGLALPQTMRNAEPVRRAYSLALAPSACDGRLRLLVRLLPGDGRKQPPGRGSSWVYTLDAGDAVTFSGPFGDFALKPGSGEKIFIGGGAGMGPLRAMIRERLEAGGSERIHFWYGARNVSEIPYAAELQALEAAHANFSWHPVLSDPGSGHDDTAIRPLLRGLVHEAVHAALLSAHPSLASCEFYLCGPPGMLSATRQLLAKLGIPEDRIAFDDFKI